MKIKLPSKRAFVETLKFLGVMLLIAIGISIIMATLRYLFGEVVVFVFGIALLLALIFSLMKEFDKTEKDNEQNKKNKS